MERFLVFSPPMKIIITCLLAVAAIAASAQTTEQEYIYLTKGLKADLESARDIKSGYALQVIEQHVEGNYTYEFYKFLRKENEQLAALLIIAKDKSMFGVTTYFCVPINNPSLQGQFLKDVNDKLVPINARIVFYATALLLAKNLH